ncbi:MULTISPECIES: winged helix-turn-helix transcriptional regulator [Pantoea]|jgi:DNA-binding HxlR family transcriptional regulator|uniref:Transcriptional regulator n=1 Tax=Pantoea brenneri TaxID=472694 RepID=A0A653Z7R4_9GAMM|nr:MULTISPECIES: helix-turn-helix domain-containing protein [Pantoea]MBS6033893.1 helix-turn-helix transcriptional regulator [Pantoea sp.]MBZ6396818.1 helix-turn-helix transcriptional regulator [Pantoea sp.]MBZ6439981.1 helix-turn-helix transcriptional regulator [Pantoea sp.]MDH2124414.1 helix-turn-helix transcriptional regulator [Pantoea brenneri]NUY43063.1 helix-turn-helix transcriptional regulator [Pantoea brenneri]
MPVWVDGKLCFYADSPPRRLLELFAVKWSTMVLHALYHWPENRARTGELERSLQGISKKMLIQTLRELEQRGLVLRQVYQVVPPKVEYSLTALGHRFAEPIEQMYQWGLENQAALDEMERHARESQDTAG